MGDSHGFRARLLSALGISVVVSSFVPAGCAGSTAEKEDLEPSCDGAAVQCFPPGQTHFNHQVPVEPPPEATFDANGCQLIGEVRNGCCNAAQTAGFVDGQCCYGFCTGACCGRPMIVGGAPRLAGVEHRRDWAAPLDPGSAVGELGDELRASLAAAWQHDAQMEHASIASFARFTLDLLAFAAPAALLDAAQRAIADELRHARDCFALASLYGGAPLGPGALDLGGVTTSASLAQAAAAAVREGCIGETIAAFTASAQAEAAGMPQVRAVLSRIAGDESSHAELAWRFVRWALSQGAEDVRRAVEAAFAEARSEFSPSQPHDPSEATLNAHGRLSERQRSLLAHQALHEIIAPSAQALLAAS